MPQDEVVKEEAPGLDLEKEEASGVGP